MVNSDGWPGLRQDVDEVATDAKALHCGLDAISQRLLNLSEANPQCAKGDCKTAVAAATTDITGADIEQWQSCKGQLRRMKREEAQLREAKTEVEAELQQFLEAERTNSSSSQVRRQRRRPGDQLSLAEEADRLRDENQTLREERNDLQFQLKGEKGFQHRRAQDLEAKIKRLERQNRKLEAGGEEFDEAARIQVGILQEQNKELSSRVQSAREERLKVEKKLRVELDAARMHLSRAEEKAHKQAMADRPRLRAESLKAEVREAEAELEASRRREERLEEAVARRKPQGAASEDPVPPRNPGCRSQPAYPQCQAVQCVSGMAKVVKRHVLALLI